MKRIGKESTANENNKYAKKTYLFSASLIERLTLGFAAFAQEPHSAWPLSYISGSLLNQE